MYVRNQDCALDPPLPSLALGLPSDPWLLADSRPQADRLPSVLPRWAASRFESTRLVLGREVAQTVTDHAHDGL